MALLAAFFVRRHVQAERQKTLAAAPAAQAQVLINQLRDLKMAVQQQPKDIPRRWNLVNFYQQNHMLPQAILQLSAILDLEPNNEKANVELASLLLAANQMKTAEKAYLDITHRFPDSAEAWQGLSAVYFQQGDFLEALHAAQKAHHLKPDDPNNKLALAVASLNYAMQFSQVDIYAEHYERARTLLTELTLIWPTREEVFFLLGRAERAMRRYPEAIAHLKRAQGLAPSRADIAVEMARSCAFSGDRATGRQVVETALNHGVQNADLYALEAQFLQQSAEPNGEARAVELYEKSLKLSPNDVGYMQRLGSAYLRLGRMDDAQKLFEGILRRDPNHFFPYQQLAVIYARKGDRARAKRAAKAAEGMAANENQLRQIELLCNMHPENINLHLVLAERYAQLQMDGPARDQFTQALAINPKNKRALQGMAALKAALFAPAKQP